MNFLDLCTAGVRGLVPYSPGKPLDELEREYGISDAIKLASNENPLGASPKGIAAAKQALQEAHRYPDGNGFELKAALSSATGIDQACITLGNGSNEILELLARTFVTAENEVLFSEHAFAVYPIVTQAVGATARIAKACAADSATPYGHDLDEFKKLINEKTRLVFIANPNNPTGTWLNTDALKAFIAAVPQHVIVVVDEAYCEYVDQSDYPDATKWLSEFPNLVVTRTFSKIYGLSNLRIGYSFSHPQVAELLNRVRQPFNVNGIAQAAAVAALSDDEFVQRSKSINSLGLEKLYSICKELGLGYIPSVANFLAIDFKQDAAPIYESLLHKGVIVRPIANYGLPNFLRVTIGSEDENMRFIAALKTALS